MSRTPARAAGAAVVLPPLLATLVLSLLLGLQPLSTDVYLPALPLLTNDLHAGMPRVQLTMSALMLAFGFGQLAWGPLADRFGRRPALLAGLGLYTLASLGCTLAPDIDLLIGARAVQGVGLASAVVCARAMVRDLYEPHQGVHMMSRALSGLGVIAIASPVLGGVLATLGGWRAPIGFGAAMGAAALALVALALPETARSLNPRALHLAPLATQSRRVLAHPTFQTWALLTAATFGGLFTLLSASSFAYMGVLHLTPTQYGLVMASSSVSYLLGTMWCRRWLHRHGLPGAVARGAGFSLAGGLGMALPVLLDLPLRNSVWALLLAHWLFAFGHGIHQPCGQAGVTSPFPRAAGVAAGLAGFILALTAFLVGLWLGWALHGTTGPMALGLGAWSLVVAAIAWIAVPRHGGVTPPVDEHALVAGE